jgi:hypothetical protein
MTGIGIPFQNEEQAVRMLARRMVQADARGDRVSFEQIERTWGYEAGSRIWQRACDSYDWHNAPEEFPGGMPAGAVIF